MRTITAHASLLFAACLWLHGGLRGSETNPAGGETAKSCSPALERAAQALAEQKLQVARTGFEAILKDASPPAFVRALAYIGLSETLKAAGDSQEALAAWECMAADAQLSRFHRQLAERKILEDRRALSGQPIRTPAEFREELPSLPASPTSLHVSNRGSDSADGSEAHPFASLERARDAIRSLKAARSGQLPANGVRVILEAGDYPVTRTLHLTALDSGTAEAPVVYQARTGAVARLRGGERIRNWKPVSDPAVRSRLPPTAAATVLEADLEPFGPRDWGDPTALRKRPELFANGVPQVLARWPNEGFVQTGEILGTNRFKVWDTLAGCKDGRFRFAENQPRTWLDEPDVRLYGYWFWDWYEEFQRVTAIDSEERSFALAEPYSSYGYRQGQRYYAVNVFRELDQPGEWYLDRSVRRLYWLPPVGLDPAQADVVLSMFDAPFIHLQEAEHVILQGLILEEGRGNGVQISGGTDCLVAGCVLRRLGGDAVVVNGGKHHGVFGCRMETLGCGGASVKGGDQLTLEAGRHFVENCTVSDISRLKRTYTPAVHLEGCGNRIAHNRFENMPSSALRVEGNDHLIELNLIRDVVRESDDQGGLDMFGNPLYRGVVIRWNRWTNIGGGTHNGAAGVRLDDMISGVVVYGNIFERCGAVIFGGVQIHGGKDNLVDGNLFLDGFAGVSFSRWGEKRWLESIARFLEQAEHPTLLARYPELATLRTGFDVNDLSRNLFVRCGPMFLRDGGKPRSVLESAIADAINADIVASPETVRAQTMFRGLLFDSIPVPEIGPYPHPWRAP